jgi:hypothetical protein
MSLDDLVCAACSGRVSEERCATCRAARTEHQAPGRPEVFLAVAALALVLLVVLVA